MKQFLIIGICILLVFISCKKSTTETTNPIVGQWKWIVEYKGGAPGNTLTPQSTGIQETVFFNSNKSYSVIQNGVTINSGTYKNGITKSPSGQNVETVYFTNNRVADSASYFGKYGNDTLYFSTGLIGVIGSGARYYTK